MTKFKKNKGLKSVVCGILALCLLLGAVGFVSSFFNDDTSEISARAFVRGKLDENGKFVESEQSIYTREAFECKGLRIEPDFESQVTYDVYYYDYDEKLVEVKTGLTEIYDEDFPLAKLCRVVIHPEIPEGETARSFKIGYFEVYKFARELNITVDKDQNYLYADSVNLYNASAVQAGKTFNADEDVVTLSENEAAKVTEQIRISGEYDYYDVYVRKATENDISAAVVIADVENGEIFARKACDVSDLNLDEWAKITIELPKLESDSYILVRLAAEADCYIFGYNK